MNGGGGAASDAAGPASGASGALGPVAPLLFGLGGATLLLHCLTNGGYNFFRDEFYYIACGRHPAWGYVDHPPLVALVARLAGVMFGDSLSGLRFFPAMAAAATVVLAGMIAARLGGGMWAQGLAALGVIVGPVYLATFTIFTMNAFDILFWTLALYLLVRILGGDSPRLWIALGAVAGVGLLNKHSMIFLLAGVAAGVILTDARRHLMTPWPWLGGLVAALIFSPHLAWQARNGWPTLEFMENARRFKNFPVSPAGFLWGQILLLHPLTLPIWAAGCGWLLAAREARPWRALGWAYLFILTVFIVTRAKIYYLAPFYPILLAAGAVALERLTRARGRWLRPAVAAAWIAGGVVLAPAVLPVLPPERLAGYLEWLHLREPPTERHRAPPLPQVFSDMFGWEEMVARVAAVYNALTPGERARCVIFASNYGEAGAIDFYGGRYGLPGAVSGHNNYWLWGPGTTPATIAITIGEDREDVEKTFANVVEADRTESKFAMPYENDVPIYLARDPVTDLTAVWPRCKKYI